MRRPILEREHELAELAAAARQAKDGDGSIVLILGEAGIGKSSLVDALRSVLPAEGRLLVGYCDDLATPRVLGPLRDLVGSVGTALTAALESGDRGRVIEALRAELDWPGHATVLVVEDVHWADEATLDVLRYLVRRISGLPVVLVLTYRDEELTPDHPLQQLLGLAAGTPSLRRLPLARLSADAVRRLGAQSGLDATEVFAVTSGNPFFVTEVLATGEVGGVPNTIAEAVRGRLRGLDGPTRDTLEQLSVVPSAVQRWLVEAVVPGGVGALATAEQHGMLVVSPARITFRHELMRRAIADSMPGARRVARNEAVLAALLARADGVEPSRIVHHAAEAGDDDVIVRHGPAAAREATAAGSHREAVAHYRLVLGHRAAYPPDELARLLDEYAIECYTVGLAEDAVGVQQEAIELHRRLGDAAALGRSLRWLSRFSWWSGARQQAEAAGAEAIEVLSDGDDRHALALALSNQSQLYALMGHRADCIAIGKRAVAMARELGDAALLSHSLNNIGLAYWDDGRPEGPASLAESLQVALAAGETEHACRAYVNTIWQLLNDLRLDDADRLLGQAMELANEAEFLGFLRYLVVSRSMLDLARGAWAQAEAGAQQASTSELVSRCPALVVLGLARERRGQDGSAALAEAWDIAKQLGEPQRLSPAGAALLEAGWLRGDGAAEAAAAEVAPWYDLVRRLGNPAYAAELGYWLRAAGTDVPVNDTGRPYALLAAGKWRAAAQAWQRAGYPYEHAAALAVSPDADDLRQALTILDGLGAEPLARRVRARLRDLGVAHIPRGPAPATRGNPAGLTHRQVEVVQLLADGLSNAEIATRLTLSVRTVDTHVAAILHKLDARTRRDAATRAAALGLVGEG